MSRTLALLVLLGACSAPAPNPSAVPGFEVQDAPVWTVEGVRVATFNGEFMFDGQGDEGEATFDWKGDPAKARAHRDDIGAVVRSLDADLVLMTEIENLETLEMLVAESLEGMGYQAVLIDGRDSFTGQDVGLLSRFDYRGRWPHRRSASGRHQRPDVRRVQEPCGLVVSMPDGTPVTVVGLHFLARPDAVDRRDRRETQAEVIRQFIEGEQAAGREIIALGDFNDIDDAVLDRRGSVTITNVMATIKRAGPSPDDDLVNVLGEVPQAERFTSFYDRNRNDRFEQGEFSAIDHVLLSPALYRRVLEVRFVHSHDPREVSDHFPVVVTLAE